MAPWMVPGGINYSAVDSPGGPLLGGTTYSMTFPYVGFENESLKAPW